MNWNKELISKISNKKAPIDIVGLGYVGLRLAVAFSKKFKVVGNNKNRKKVELLRNNKSYIDDIANEEINLNNFIPTAYPKDLKNCDFILIAFQRH